LSIFKKLYLKSKHLADFFPFALPARKYEMTRVIGMKWRDT
jgi:hypothetical protein